MKVLKFGGSSVGSAQGLRQVRRIVAANDGQIVVVVSALGGITDRLLATAAGRRGLVGLSASWEDASVPETTATLQGMRVSSMALKVQAYQGLHDIVCAPYFSGEESWGVLGYPGPQAV